MISADTNIFICAANIHAPENVAAMAFLESVQTDSDFCTSGYMLTELYCQLRNGAIFEKPLSAPAAAARCRMYMDNPAWQYIGYIPGIEDELWAMAMDKSFARGRIYDARMAITLVQSGVTEFATANVKDFQGFGFKRVWNPLEG